MAHNWFQFKAFKIEQDRCAMKVSTDACIQGALAAAFLSCAKEQYKNILDIGTGTGLLSLMIAQNMEEVQIEAIEIEPNAFAQAQENFRNAPWAGRLKVFHSSLQNRLLKSQDPQYDFIICNPPFFQNQLQAKRKERNTARHGILLNPETLLIAIKCLLKKEGIFCVLYPENGWHDFLKMALEQRLYLKKIIKVYPKATAPCNRNVAFFSKIKQDCFQEEKLVIYSHPGKYTPAFTALMKDYYL